MGKLCDLFLIYQVRDKRLVRGAPDFEKEVLQKITRKKSHSKKPLKGRSVDRGSALRGQGKPGKNLKGGNSGGLIQGKSARGDVLWRVCFERGKRKRDDGNGRSGPGSTSSCRISNNQVC